MDGDEHEERGPAEARARVLVVDDDENLRKLLVLMLKHAGHEPVAVGTLAQARAVDADTVDVVVCDLHLADGNGLELIARLKADHARAPFVMISGDHDPAVIEDVKAVGGMYLPKPFTADELAGIVSRALSA